MAQNEIDTDAIFQQVMAMPMVKAKVQDRAAKVSARIRRDLNKAGITATVTSDPYHGTTGRASYNISGSVTDPTQARRAGRIARRAARSVRR